MPTATTRSLVVDYVTFDGANHAEVTDLIGDLARIGDGGTLKVLTADGDEVSVRPGWTVIRYSDDAAGVVALAQWERVFAPEV